MGFSVSGSAAIIFAGMFIGFGILYGAVSDGHERVSDAQDARTDDALETENTAINVTSTEYVGTNDRLTVLVENTGASALALNTTDFLIENDYVTDWQGSATVAGQDDTWLWLPGEQLNITVRTSEVPAQVTVVTGNGVARTAEVN
ncbi:flagellin [Halorientalis pallida]|uniref:flagellin n=1 Tax=Halorientalis pallida TaxID=2479928 RepID=UPI003C6EF95D